MQMNTVVAKALAEKVVKQLMKIKEQKEADNKANTLKTLAETGLVEQFNKKMDEAELIYKSAIKQLREQGFKFNVNIFSKPTLEGKLSFYGQDSEVVIPQINDVKNDIILGTITEPFDMDTFIADLVKNYIK
jgi:hypothetical protein